MGGTTEIEWTTRRWNPIRARLIGPDGAAIRWADGKARFGWLCEKVSPGCDHCYAEGFNRRLGTGLAYKKGLLDAVERDGRLSDGVCREAGLPAGTRVEVFLDEGELAAPLGWQPRRWKGPPLCFVGTMTDLFARFVPDAWLDRILAVIALQPAVTFQILTKRSARMRGYCARPHMGREIWALADTIATDERLGHGHASFAYLMAGSDAAPWPLDNLWLGVSVEDQTRADGRIPDLLATPAAVRFVSAEPLLGAIDLNRDIGGTLWIGGQRGCGGAHQHGGPMPHDHGPGTSLVQGDPRQMHHHHDNRCKAGLDWIIAGGESGREARPMHPAWARGLRDQCASAGVPFFFKQWGDWLPAGQDGAYRDGDQILNCSDEPVRVGKAAAGRLLDGATHDAMPALRTGTGAG